MFAFPLLISTVEGELNKWLNQVRMMDAGRDTRKWRAGRGKGVK